MPLDIRGFIREKKSAYMEAQIAKKGQKIENLREEAGQAKQYNTLDASEKQLKGEIEKARQSRRKGSALGKLQAAAKAYKKKKKKGLNGPSGIFTSSGRGPFE